MADRSTASTDPPRLDRLFEPTPAATHILLALIGGDLHGYGLMKEVAEISAGSFTLGPGTLYRSLQRMERDRLIEEAAAPADADRADERRRYYRLTELGRAVIEAEVRRFEALVSVARGRGLA